MAGSHPTPNPVDYLKYNAAEAGSILEYVTDQLSWLTVDHPETEYEIETLQDALANVRDMLTQSAATFSRDMNTYSDGRRVESVLELEKGSYFRYRWHPEPTHQDNRPRTIVDRHDCTSGERRSVIIAADQVLDAVDYTPRLQLVDRPTIGE